MEKYRAVPEAWLQKVMGIIQTLPLPHCKTEELMREASSFGEAKILPEDPSKPTGTLPLEG